MELIEREEAFAALDNRLGAARRGDGTVVLVHGEAGVGKTCLLRARTGGLPAGVRRAWGRATRCRRRARWAPLREAASELGGPVLETLRAGSAAHDAFVAFVAELRQARMWWCSRICIGRMRRRSICCATRAAASTRPRPCWF